LNQTSVFLFGFIGVALLYTKSFFNFNRVLHKPSRKSSQQSSPFPSLLGRIGGAVFLLISFNATAQNTSTKLWHDKERTIHYQPQGNDFILYKGTRKFNRALYGTNTGFRVEAGDLPEFALYMPGMGGNCKIGISINGKSKWITTASQIKTIYRPGTMLYQIKDSLLGKGQISLSVLAMADAEGMIIKMETENIPANTNLVIVYGGATGKKFSRDGDIGADPESSFYLQSAYCKDNRYTIFKNTFQLSYGLSKALSEEERYEIQYGNKQADTTAKEKPKQLIGVFPENAEVQIADAEEQNTPDALLASSANLKLPVVAATVALQKKETLYFLIQKPDATITYPDVADQFIKAEAARKKIADRIVLQTPDAYINPLGGALAIAADAIWEEPTYMHGAIAWRMRLPAWRGPYAADPLGWHDRARTHFSSYALSQVTKIPAGPVVFDTALHIARQQEKMGTAMFSNGYISRNPGGDIRPHHYDMNLVYIDELLNHFNYTGDIEYVKKMWPTIKLHLQWEKRNFDADGDGLYDAYAAIWASDALQYSGGGVTHSSAYNYRANKTAAMLAKLIGEDGSIYEAEANKIFAAMNKNLWLKDKGWFAENKDLMGLQLVHPSAALWTVYHAIDEGVADARQRYQMLRYVDNHIPYIPVKINGLKDEGYYLLSTTNWQPYTWSINNVGLGENLHTALAYWQGGENDNAYKLWKSTLVESMYASASPGGFQQLSFYDAIRGELYRDFADGIGMTARSLTEGLFGILPDALNDKLVIKPGFPTDWKFAKIAVPDISIDFKQDKNITTYNIVQSYKKLLNVTLQLKALKDKVVSVTVNGKQAKWNWIQESIGQPAIEIAAGNTKNILVKIIWSGNDIEHILVAPVYKPGQKLLINLTKAKCTDTNDLQKIFSSIKYSGNSIECIASGRNTVASFFMQLKQGDAVWTEPVSFDARTISAAIPFVPPATASFSTVNLQPYFNDKVMQIFKNKYLSPRPQSPTLQIPWQGIGNWCYPLTEANINDSGTRVKAGNANTIYLDKIPFATPSAMDANNILYTSQWDNYPKSATVPLSGKAQHAYLLMAGSTNHQQSQFTNAKIIVTYKDGTTDELPLINPSNWYPIEQDYLEDGYAFTTGAPKPYRLLLKTGVFTKTIDKFSSIKGFSNRAIDGGAATVIEMPIDKNKELESLTLETRANEVVVGLMSITLVTKN
jgi:Domain of unknown function (DUF4450)/Bacterial alpha-L-rhamnosidase 6 hairpin glycosidase domain